MLNLILTKIFRNLHWICKWKHKTTVTPASTATVWIFPNSNNKKIFRFTIKHYLYHKYTSMTFDVSIGHWYFKTIGLILVAAFWNKNSVGSPQYEWHEIPNCYLKCIFQYFSLILFSFKKISIIFITIWTRIWFQYKHNGLW